MDPEWTFPSNRLNLGIITFSQWNIHASLRELFYLSEQIKNRQFHDVLDH